MTDRRLEIITETFGRLAKNRTSVLGLGIIVGLGTLAVLAPFLTPYSPTKIELANKLLSPSEEHPFGTDELGRDILSRILFGARFSLFIGVLAVLLGTCIGVPIGVISGYFAGRVDLVIQRFVDIMLSFPGILLALTLVAVLGVGLENVIVAVGVSSIPVYIRLVRGVALQIRQLDYIQAARALGLSTPRILVRHVILNSLSPVIVQSSLQLGTAILVAAGLGFLGLGVKPPTPEWGAMLSSGRSYLFSAPHAATFPGFMIFLAVLGFNLLGDGLRDALDPRLRTL